MSHSKKIDLRLISLIFIGTILTLFLTGCGSKKVAVKDPNNIQITTSLDFYGEVAKEVLGNQGSVTSIINKSDIDPHDYEPTTDVAKKISNSDIIINNGLGYDDWMEKLSQNNSHSLNINVGKDVLKRDNGVNPHIWYDYKTLPSLANYLANEFSKINPNKKDYFKNNAKKYITSLKPIENLMNDIKLKNKNNLVDVSEPVFDYSLLALNYKKNDASFSSAIENSTDPSPKSVGKVEDDIKNHKIDFFVQNPQTQTKTTMRLVNLAKKHNVAVLNVTETKPDGKNYKEWMLSQYKEVQKIQNSTLKNNKND